MNQLVLDILHSTLYYTSHWRYQSNMCLTHGFQSVSSTNTSQYFVLYYSLKVQSNMCLKHGFNQLVPQILPNTLYYSTHWITNLTSFWLIIFHSTHSRLTSLLHCFYTTHWSTNQTCVWNMVDNQLVLQILPNTL